MAGVSRIGIMCAIINQRIYAMQARLLPCRAPYSSKRRARAKDPIRPCVVAQVLACPMGWSRATLA